MMSVLMFCGHILINAAGRGKHAPGVLGEDVPGPSLLGFKEGFWKEQQLSPFLREEEEVVRQTRLGFGVTP